VGTRKTIPAGEIAAALERLASAVAIRHRSAINLVLLGIANGGVPVCRRLHQAVEAAVDHPLPQGVINVAFHRDDVGRHPIPKMAAQTSIPCDLEGATVVLIDDVLFSGRTVRAALEELFAHGRPTRVELAVLVDRGNRRLPIAPDYCGFTEATTPDERVRVALDDTDTARDAITIASPA
jgi:pyrimidine operon attenuation protein / uracil phosphoribosyltransferase